MHPSREELQSLAEGSLDELQALGVIEHVDQCETCEDTLVSFEAASSTRAGALREPVPEQSFVREPACQRAVALVTDIVAGPQNGSADVPQQIGQYRLQDQIGAGGMGVVYRAKHLKLDRIVALKILPRQRLQDVEAVARFEREMRAVGRLDHPHLVRAIDADEVDGVQFLAMEFIPGHNLSYHAKRLGPLPVSEACEIIRQAAIGLQEAHEHGLVHRDIKPGNLMLAETRHGPPVVKILDMGLASFASRNSTEALTSTGQAMGTLDYMAPEQCGKGTSVDIRADVYGMGATLYRLLVGDVIFPSSDYPTPVQKLTALATEKVLLIRNRRSDIPAALATVIHRMLAKEPGDRYATPQQVALAVAPFCQDADLRLLLQEEIASDAPANSSESGDENQRRRQFLLIGSGLLGTILLIAAAIFFLQTPHGLLRVEINDPEVQVRVKGTQITLKAADRQKVTLKPGQHVLRVKRDDVEFETKEFVISRDDTVVVRVDVLDGAVVARQNGTVIGRAGRDPLRPDSSPQSALPRRETSIDPDRAFVNWPQAPGMLLTIEIDGDRQQLTCRNANIPGIPAQPFHVVGVVFNLHQGKAATAADVARLISSGLQHVDTVGFNYQNPRPEWLEALHDAMPDVKNFEFAGLEEHIPVISRFEKLEYMQVAEKATEWIDMLSRKQSVERLLFSGRLSIADCEKLAKFSSLRELTFSDAITDEAFLALSKSSCLTRLQIYTKTREWNATAEGIAHLAKLESLRILTFGNNELPPIFNPQALKQKLPWCRIEFSQGGQMKILPAEPHPQARHTLQLHAM